MLAVRLRAGRIDDVELESKRGAWLAAWRKALLPRYVPYAWLHGYAAVAAHIGTAAEAKRALDAQVSFGAIPTYAPRTLAAADVGRTFLATGRIDEALPWLEAATRECSAFDEPFAHTRAHLDLGLAREAKGDRDGACRAYDVVVARWGR